MKSTLFFLGVSLFLLNGCGNQNDNAKSAVQAPVTRLSGQRNFAGGADAPAPYPSEQAPEAPLVVTANADTFCWVGTLEDWTDCMNMYGGDSSMCCAYNFPDNHNFHDQAPDRALASSGSSRGRSPNIIGD